MAGPIATDTPDYQRGIFNPQALLATVPANTATVTVGVPTNAETLIVAAADIADGGTIFAQGVSTLYKYAGVRLPTQPHMTTATTWFFDVSAAMDERVQITFTDAPGEIWFVYADAAAHVIGDASTLKNTQGAVYSIPSAPATDSGDHPPVELQLASILDAANGTVLVAPPGAGVRLRVFDAFVNATSTAAFVALRTSSTGKQIVGLGSTGGNTAGHISCAPSGVPLPTNEGINMVATAGNADGTVTYTVEIV